MLRTFSFFLSLVTLAACGAGTPPVETAAGLSSPATLPTAPQKKSPGSDFRAEAVPSDQPNVYRVDLKWDAPKSETPSGRCFVEREDASRHERLTFPEVDCAVGLYQDDRSLAGRRYRYRLRAVDLGGALAEATTEITVPRDLVLRGEQSAPALDGIARLFLLQGARIRTEGLPWRGVLDELVAEDAVVETFRETTLRAAAGGDGRSAAPIALRVRRARGKLELRLLGQSGGDGVSGTAGAAGKDGKDGRRAELDFDPDFFRNQPNLARFRDAYFKAAWEGTPIGQNAGASMRCSMPGTNGEDGAPGSPGTAGGRGGHGGSSPRTLLVVENGEHFRLTQPKAEGGRGGFGGFGGKGGLGGRGGAAGATDKTGICPATQPGKMGADGVKGEDGENGADGSTEPVCVVMAGSRTGDCEPFAAEIAP